MPQFDDWLDGIRDKLTVMRLRKRLRKATLGNLGDVAPVGEGVPPCRVAFGRPFLSICSTLNLC